MLQKSIFFLQTANGGKNFHLEPQLNSSSYFYSGVHFRVLITCILINILGLIGNGIIFLLFCCTIKKTKYTIYVVNLAAGDCLVLLYTLIAEFQWYTTGSISTRFTKVLLSFFFFGHDNTGYFLAAMSTERCLYVFFPVWYQFHRHKCSTAIACTFIWTLSVTLTMCKYFLCDVYNTDYWNNDRHSCAPISGLADIIRIIIITLVLVFSTLPPCIRMKIKPQQDFPARLDISLWITVVFYILCFPGIELIDMNLYSTISPIHHVDLSYAKWIIESIGHTVNPIIYLLVGCWKWEKSQGPFYMFLERALKDNGRGRMRTQPEQVET